jgi:hypothetical protein
MSATERPYPETKPFSAKRSRGTKLLELTGIGALAVFGLMQFVRMDLRNGRIRPNETLEAVLQPPAEVTSVLNACRDCHTSKTQWRWYSKVAPFMWLTAADVYTGRAHLNYSQWARYTPAQQVDRLQGTCKQVRDGDMPPWFYKPLHPGLWLDKAKIDTLCRWTEGELAKLPKPAANAAPAGTQRPARP